ncbi:MAG: gamma-glutamyl-gamma-aminobutyrate hydrolase family protein, partial [candidate division Zixibacteria bacterium]
MRSRKPKIGITLSEAESILKFRWPMSRGFDYVKRDYYESILKSGGIPVLLPNVEEKANIKALFDSIDGLLVTGGVDMHPRYFSQKPHKKLSRTTKARDNFEMEIIRKALRKNMPILGICRGHQILNIALGGD